VVLQPINPYFFIVVAFSSQINSTQRCSTVGHLMHSARGIVRFHVPYPTGTRSTIGVFNADRKHGEPSETSFQAYAADRLSGIEPITLEPGERPRENIAFPMFYRGGAHSGPTPMGVHGADQIYRARPTCKISSGPLQGTAPADVFIPSASPSSRAGFMENRNYKNEEDQSLRWRRRCSRNTRQSSRLASPKTLRRHACTPAS
jgi:hypothetical protein